MICTSYFCFYKLIFTLRFYFSTLLQQMTKVNKKCDSCHIQLRLFIFYIFLELLFNQCIFYSGQLPLIFFMAAFFLESKSLNHILARCLCPICFLAALMFHYLLLNKTMFFSPRGNGVQRIPDVLQTEAASKQLAPTVILQKFIQQISCD